MFTDNNDIIVKSERKFLILKNFQKPKNMYNDMLHIILYEADKEPLSSWYMQLDNIWHRERRNWNLRIYHENRYTNWSTIHDMIYHKNLNEISFNIILCKAKINKYTYYTILNNIQNINLKINNNLENSNYCISLYI